MNDNVIKKFYSKKNQVELVERGGTFCIRKIFTDNISCAKEKAELEALRDQNVPKIIETGDNYIYMTYLEGELFLDRFLTADNAELERLALMLAAFIKSYCAIRHGRCVSDLNFRNFILCKQTLFGVDFEDTEEGGEITAVSKAVAFALLYDIEENNKKSFCEKLISEFSFDKKEIDKAVNKELSCLALRRGITLKS
ncbi:MAG: hypothetical protein EOM87_04770 [Clostridia bacterium]|nr:hypothetical protein [Clostridia bacterium]